MRTLFVAGNWKMNPKDLAEAAVSPGRGGQGGRGSGR